MLIPHPCADYHRASNPRSAYVYRVLNSDGRVAYQVFSRLWLGVETFTVYRVIDDGASIQEVATDLPSAISVENAIWRNATAV